MKSVEKAAEYVCDNLCKYAVMKGKTQQWLDKVCERCRLEEKLRNIKAGGKIGMLLEKQVIDEISLILTNMIEKVIKIADKNGLRRDEVLKGTARVFYGMMEVATYEEYQFKRLEECTHIEKIRSMSVEELADKILASEVSTMFDFYQNFSECEKRIEKGEELPDEMCKKCLVKWLNSPEEQKKVIPKQHFEDRFNKVL